ELDYDTLYDIDLYDRNKAFPSIAGSYYAACVLYSSVTGRATTGMPFYGYLDADTAVLLQGAADRFLTSANDHNASPITLAAHETTYVQRPMTLEEADPRNRPADPDPAFADDVTQYPDNYDVLLSSAYAYYARGSFVQYDNMGMDRVHRTGARRTVAYEKATSYSNFLANDKSSPEDATPQKILYTDCSAYIYSAMTDAFYYSFNFNFKNRSNAMFDDTEVMAPLTVFSWRQTTDNPSLSLSKAEEASAEMKAALHPGDIIIFTNESRDSTVGHIMLYIGNGKMLHSTGRNAFGGGENYLFRNGTEEYEMYGAVLYDNVKEVTDVGRWLCPFMNENWLCKVFRPNYGSYSPSAKATARLESLKNTIVYKETTAPEGVTVSAGGDVTFTVVVYNYGKTEQTYTITDTIPSNTTFKSKDAAFTLNGASLSASVTLAPQETARLSYTVTVNAVGAWTTIPCKSTYVNGVLLNNTRIIVAPTLLAEEQDELIYLLESRGPSASSDLALALSLYDGLTFSTKAEAFTSIYTPQTGGTYTNVVSSGDYVTMNVTVSNKGSYALATCLFGGVGHKTQSPDCYDRVKHISTDNMVAGDLLFALDNPLNGSMHDRITDLENNVRVYVYADGGRLATVENGSYVLYSKTHSQALTESLPGHFAFFVLRPSIQGATPKKDVYSIHIWGDAMVSTNNPMDILYAMAEASGKKVRITANVYDNLGKTSTYQHYEFFNWNSSNTEMTSVRSTAFVNSITSPLDCLIMSTGRDASVGYPATKTRNLNAYEAIQDMYFEANPNGRILLSVPFPYENDSTLMAQKYVGRFTTAEQKIKIKEIAEEYEARTSGAKASLYLGDAFDFFAENYSDTGIKLYDDCGDYASIPGAYYMACLYYAAVFGESPVGIPEYGEIDRASAIILQNAAHSFFFGTDPAQVTQERAPVLRTSYKELNPKTMTYRDPKYAHEVYPAYYDELFATAYMYYAMGRAVQYDQMSLDNVTKTVRRLTQGAAPEELTPQRLTYLDCTWFVHSAYKSAVNYVLKPSLGSKVINITEGCVYRWVGPDGTVPVEDAVAEFRATLQPGDVMMYFDRSAGQGHGMLYLGNGIYIHCSSSNRKSRGSADYNFSADIDAREYLGGVDFGKLDLIIDPSLNTCFFKSNEEVSIIRPLSLGYTPTENATKRLNNLAGVVTWKETTAYRGQTVNPGDDVTFTYVLRNDNDTAKTVAIKDVLPDFTVYKSGDIAFTNGSLNTSVVVPALSEKRISFTVTVLETAEASVIACDKTQFGGITHYCNPIYVARTLTPEEQATVSSASVTASSATELIAKTYALIGQTVNIPENSELINSLFTIGGSADPYYYATVGTGYYSTLIPQYLTGGKNMKGELSGNRIKNITLDNLMCGDVLAVMADNATVKLYLCLVDKSFKTVTDGSVETIVPANAATFVDKLMAKFAFAVIRPSRAFPTKGEISRLSTYNNEPLNVSFLGDAFVTQDTANYFGAFCFEGGRPINSKGTGNVTRNINQNTEYTSYSYYTTYSPYLLWDSADQPTLSPENAGTSLKIMTSPDSPPLDFFIIQSGRDRLLFNSADATKAVKAVKAIYDLLKAQNPDGELVILVPPAFPDNGQPNYYTYNMGTYNYENCKARISNLATRYANAVGNDCIMIRADEATYFFDENYGADSGISLFRDDSRTPNEAGAYFTSALMYATLLNKSPYGMEFSAYLTEDESRLLQRAAHRFVFGSDPEAPAAPPAGRSLPIFEQDSRFTHEEAPKNFEYLLATAEAYFDRHLWIQYDQLGMMRTGSAISFYRRTTDTSAAPNLGSPEAGTPQSTLYLDCTAFVWSLIKDTFNYDLPENRSKPLSYDPNGTLASMTAFKFVSVANGDDTYSMTYQTDGDPVPCTSEEAAAVFLKTLRPGDVIAYSNDGNGRGHGVIYLGNGYVMQCTSASRLDGTSADYNYDGKYDSHEGRGGIRIDKIDFMTTPGRSSFQFDGQYLMTIRVTRPDYASMTPTANAIARVKGASSDPYVSSDYYNMRHVVAYRLTSAPEGVTVNPNDTVKMTVVLKNVGDHTKIISVTDSLPSTLTLESGQNNFTVTVAPGETVTREYTVRVKPTVANGTYIEYKNMKANGLTLNDTTIGVNKTLTESEQNSFKDYIASGSLSSAGGLLKLYKNAYSSLGISLDLTDEEALISALTVQGSTSAAYVNTLKFNTSSPYYSYAAKGLFGGRHNYNTSYRRMKYIGWQNLVCGDVIIVAARENKSGDENEGKIKSYRSYIYLGDRTFAFDEGGSLKIVTGTAEAMNILETLPGEYYFCTLRPSLLKS
ncbi:MAG: C40 family peptidase, partial [Clostridia bacterium]|nr:C40 family peptidase [Clostridia bacterium]